MYVTPFAPDISVHGPLVPVAELCHWMVPFAYEDAVDGDRLSVVVPDEQMVVVEADAVTVAGSTVIDLLSTAVQVVVELAAFAVTVAAPAADEMKYTVVALVLAMYGVVPAASRYRAPPVTVHV